MSEAKWIVAVKRDRVAEKFKIQINLPFDATDEFIAAKFESARTSLERLRSVT